MRFPTDSVFGSGDFLQQIFLLSQKLRACFGLTERLEIVFEQTAQSPQFADHPGIHMGIFTCLRFP
jgi:hypothetical protein